MFLCGPASLWETVLLISCVFLRAFTAAECWSCEQLRWTSPKYIIWCERPACPKQLCLLHTPLAPAAMSRPARTRTHTHTHSLPKSLLHLATFHPNDGHYHFSITFAGLSCCFSGVLYCIVKFKEYAPKHYEPNIIWFKYYHLIHPERFKMHFYNTIIQFYLCF